MMLLSLPVPISYYAADTERAASPPDPDAPMGLHHLVSSVQGFLEAYDSVRSRVLGVAGEVLGEEADAWHVHVTGHSLGGALATLCCYELANRRCTSSPGVRMFELDGSLH